MIRRYKSGDVIKILEFLKSNIQMLIMFQANVVNKKNYAYECHISENDDVIDTVIISQHDTSFVKMTENSDVEEIVAFLRFNASLQAIKGECKDMDRLLPQFEQAEQELYSVAVLSEPPNIFECPYSIRETSDIGDLRSVHSILTDSGMESMSFNEFYMFRRESVVEMKSRIFVACDGEKIVATASTLYEMLPLSFLGAVATCEEYKNKGIAKALVSHLCATLSQGGFVPYIAFSNPIAAKVYHDIGFKEVLNCKTLK